jgi:putative aldouronate transport system substrate-binding protein
MDSRSDAALGRRNFLAVLGSAAASVSGLSLAGCSKRAQTGGAAANADQVAAILPAYKPLSLVTPDIPSAGGLPAGFVRYPRDLPRAIKDKPGRGGPPITAMTPWWGPIPPGLGRNTFIDAVNAELGVAVTPSVQDGSTYAAKMSAMLGARDVPELLCAPTWEIDKIPRFSQAVKALFEDLTPHLTRDAVSAYPMLATLPTAAWQYSVWGGQVSAVPYPTDGPFPWALFYRKDLTDKAGVAAPKTIDELYQFGKSMTDAARGVWAFGNIFSMVQMFYKCPGSGGWRKKPGGGLVHRYELPEYKQALEFTARLYKDGFVHPDIVASNGADSKQLFNAGKLIAVQDGIGAWRGMQSEQAKLTPGFNMQPLPVFSATGGDPLSWASDAPIFYTFVKKGLGQARVQELLRVLDWCAAPFGSWEHELSAYGVEGKHFTRAADGSPLPTELGRSELCEQFRFLGGRAPALVATADVPNFLQDLLDYSKRTIQYREPDLFAGIKLELPANYSKLLVNTEDKINDVVRGRRPHSDLDGIVDEWRRAGGDEGRAFFEKALVDNGRA